MEEKVACDTCWNFARKLFPCQVVLLLSISLQKLFTVLFSPCLAVMLFPVPSYVLRGSV